MSKYNQNVGKKWRIKDTNTLVLCAMLGTPLRIVALKLARNEDEVLEHTKLLRKKLNKLKNEKVY